MKVTPVDKAKASPVISAPVRAQRNFRIPFYLKVATMVLAAGIFLGVGNSYGQSKKGKAQTEQYGPGNSSDGFVVDLDTAAMRQATDAYRAYLAKNGIEDKGYELRMAVLWEKGRDYMFFDFKINTTGLESNDLRALEADGFRPKPDAHFFPFIHNGKRMVLFFTDPNRKN